MLFTLLSIVIVAAASVASPIFLNTIVHDQRDHAPEGYSYSRAAAAEQTIRLRIGLRQNNITGLQDALMAVSTPGNALYGQHLTKGQVEAFVAPSTATRELVGQWLSSYGISSTPASPAGDWIQFSIPVSQANTLISANYQVYQHTNTGKEFVRTLSYSIPEVLKDHIDSIHPTTTFDSPYAHLPLLSRSNTKRASHQDPSKRTACSTSSITPSCLQALYGIPHFPASQSSSTLGVAGFDEQFASKTDLSTFLKDFRPDLPRNTTFDLETLDGGQNSQSSSQVGVEANLDIQYTVGLASNVPTTFISVGSQVQDGALDGFLDMINFLLGQASPPHVLTVSYGQNENTISASLANSLCNACAQLGARGTSILFSSGDGGVAGVQASSCTSFIPTFPASCPFVTSVSATTGTSPEAAATFSSGGFSNIFATPSYQKSAVSSYLTALGKTNAGKFNTTGRGFPDVSAAGEGLEVVLAGRIGAVTGTSCSSPVFASVIALLNDELVDAGKSPLGFLNPFLYSSAGQASLNDITTGSNPGCSTSGFPARAGWDPVTGVGTPNFAALQTSVGGETEPFWAYDKIKE